MLVREAMGGPVDTCGMDMSAAQVAKQMYEADHGAMPVAVHGFLVGIITERDILRSVGLGNDPDLTTVKDLMTPDPDYLEPDVSVEDAAEWMLAAGYRPGQSDDYLRRTGTKVWGEHAGSRSSHSGAGPV